MRIIAVAVVLLLAGCGTMSATRQAATGPIPLEQPPASRVPYEEAKAKAITKPTTQKEIANYFNEASALAINNCEDWFDLVGNQEIKGALGIQQFNVLNSAAVATTGLAIADPATAAITAGSLGIVGALVNGLSDIQLRALLAGSTYSVRDGVLDGMEAYVIATQPFLETMPYSIAQIRVRRLEELCRPAAIQNMVNQSLNATQSVVSPQGKVRRMAR